MIELTDKAIRKISELHSTQSNPELRMRVFVSEGGCSGMEYGMRFDLPSDDDCILGEGSGQVLVDTASLDKIQGSILDFDDGLQGKGFSVINPQARETCGCGRSFN